MARFLVLLAVAYLLLRVAGAAFRQLSGGGTRKPVGPASPPQQVGKLVRCEVCRVHVPEERALRDGSLRFCSDECRTKAAATVAL